MSSSLVSILHQEERSIVAELRASKPFQRLEAIRRLLALYDAQPSMAAGLDAPGEAGRGNAGVIPFGAAQAAAQPVAAPAANPIVMPSAAQPPAASVAAIAEAAAADVAIRTPAATDSGETSSVVSSVRAALLGIGKH